MDSEKMSNPGQNNPQETQLAGVVRTIIAVVVLTAFFGVIGYSFWPQILMSIQGVSNQVQSSEGEPVESKFFDVRNDSSASVSQVRGVLNMMEIDYEAIVKILGKEGAAPVPVIIKDGSGQAMMDISGLVLYYDQGVIDTSTVPFFLVLWLEELNFGSGSTFYPGGLAVYITEAINTENQFWGQPSDAWVKFFREKNIYLPLEIAAQIDIPNNQEDAVQFFQGLLEGGSFMRWVAENYGIDVSRQIAAGGDPAGILSKPLSEVETSWLKAVDQKDISPKPCRMAAGRSFLNVICDTIDEKNP